MSQDKYVHRDDYEIIKGNLEALTETNKKLTEILYGNKNPDTPYDWKLLNFLAEKDEQITSLKSQLSDKGQEIRWPKVKEARKMMKDHLPEKEQYGYEFGFFKCFNWLRELLFESHPESEVKHKNSL